MQNFSGNNNGMGNTGNNVPQVFMYNCQDVRVVDIDGEPWFVAKDVCEVLEIKDARQAVSRLDKDECCLIPLTDSLGRNQETYVVSEPGLYDLIMGSRKPEAKAFNCNLCNS